MWGARGVAGARCQGEPIFNPRRAERVDLRQPLMNMALTFTEPFPVGLVVTLISAGILRRRVG